MAYPRSLLGALYSFVFFLSIAEALKFDIAAHKAGDSKAERCVRNFVAKDTLVVVTATVDGSKGDGMSVNMHVCFGLMKSLLRREVCPNLKMDRSKMLLAMNMGNPRI